MGGQLVAASPVHVRFRAAHRGRTPQCERYIRGAQCSRRGSAARRFQCDGLRVAVGVPAAGSMFERLRALFGGGCCGWRLGIRRKHSQPGYEDVEPDAGTTPAGDRCGGDSRVRRNAGGARASRSATYCPRSGEPVGAGCMGDRWVRRAVLRFLCVWWQAFASTIGDGRLRWCCAGSRSQSLAGRSGSGTHEDRGSVTARLDMMVPLEQMDWRTARTGICRGLGSGRTCGHRAWRQR